MAFSKFTIVVFIFLSFTKAIYAQSPPFETPDNWILVTSKSDEFNGSTLDTSKWLPLDPCTYTDSVRHGANGAEGAFFRTENAYVSNGNLVLKIDYNPDSLNFTYPCVHYHSYPFYSGGVNTAITYIDSEWGTGGSYSFGYYEMRAQLPGYYDSTGKSVGFGFYPTFWIAYQHIINGCITKQDEVDILEPDAEQYYDARTNVFGVWDEKGSCVVYKAIADSTRSAIPFFDGYHTFALELLPDKIIYYQDDQPLYYADTLTSPGLAHNINMAPYMVLNMSVMMGGGYNPDHPRSDAPFPEYMLIDYFRYYMLSPSYGSTNIVYQNSPNPFTGTTEIDYIVDINSENSFINIYNVLGMQVKSIKLLEKGESKIIVDKSGLSSGIYIYNLVVDNKIIGNKRLVVL